MRRTSTAFVALCALALCFLVFGSAVVWAQSGNFVLSRETVSGGTVRAGVQDRLVINSQAVFTALSGTEDDRGKLSFSLRKIDPYPFVPEVSSASLSVSNAATQQLRLYTPYIAELIEEFKESGKSAMNVQLYHYTDSLPVTLVGNGLLDAATDLPVSLNDVFRIPLPEGANIRIQRIGTAVADINVFYGGGYVAEASSTFDGEYLYLIVEVRERDSRRLADGSMMPGGEWGVCRVPVERRRDEYLARLDEVENIYPLGSDWDEARLFLDEAALLICTRVDGEVRLHVLDLVSRSASETVLFDNETLSGYGGAQSINYLEYYPRGGSGVFLLDGKLAAAVDFTGDLEVLDTAVMPYEPVELFTTGKSSYDLISGAVESYRYTGADLADCAWAEGRFYALHTVFVRLENGRAVSALLLTEWDEGGVLGAELLTTQLSELVWRYGLSETAQIVPAGNSAG
ncbi:MAG TPA: hypothetical protein IAB47_04620 [Candidatus Scatomorpha merdigallinarum]|nr:hypothetical protein [Candidatus Scatomorpha merdigallinarum]